MDGETFVANTDATMERPDRPLAKHPAQLTKEKIAFRRNEAAVEIDLRGDRLVYYQTTLSQPVLKSMTAPPNEELKVALMCNGWNGSVERVMHRNRS